MRFGFLHLLHELMETKIVLAKKGFVYYVPGEPKPRRPREGELFEEIIEQEMLFDLEEEISK